jgi:hypothetical protein
MPELREAVYPEALQKHRESRSLLLGLVPPRRDAGRALCSQGEPERSHTQAHASPRPVPHVDRQHGQQGLRSDPGRRSARRCTPGGFLLGSRALARALGPPPLRHPGVRARRSHLRGHARRQHRRHDREGSLSGAAIALQVSEPPGISGEWTPAPENSWAPRARGLGAGLAFAGRQGVGQRRGGTWA